MQSFIVLGIIPGTDIQTNLNFWIIVYALLFGAAFRMHLLDARNRLQAQIIAWRIAHTINSFEFDLI